MKSGISEQFPKSIAEVRERRNCVIRQAKQQARRAHLKKNCIKMADLGPIPELI